MSASPQVRRTDRLMDEARTAETLERGFSGRLATIGADGYPYCLPLLYLMMDGKLYVHGTSAEGHLRANVEQNNRICFEMDEPGEIFAYGRSECDSTVAYRSIILFGRIHVATDSETKRRFCEALMAKYGKEEWDRPKGFFPRIDLITVYEITIERMTGKENPLPVAAQRWPAADNTKTPNAKP
jgi:uncharacterized protein